jgi:phage gpG-like protein
MREFTVNGFAAFLSTLSFIEAQRIAMEKSAQIVEEEAKRVIGTYEYGWAPLAESTKADRRRQGFAEDEPLLRTGEMRDSIEHQSTAFEASIGSNNDKAVWQELGTSRIPPRSFLAGALQHKTEEVLDVIGREIVSVLLVR